MRLKTIKKGNRFMESDQGCNVMLLALEDAQEVDEDKRSGHECRCLVTHGAGAAKTGDEITLFECHEPGGYGLDLYLEEE